MTKRFLRWAAVIGAAALIILVMRNTFFRSKPIAVEVARAERGTVAETVANSRAGTVRASLRAQVGAETPGRVASIPKREGDVVSKDDVLVQMDTETAGRQLELARRDLEAGRARLESAHAAAELARLDRERTERLAGSGEFVSLEQLDQVRARDTSAQAEWRAVQAVLQRAEAAVRLVEQQLRDLGVRAPFDGVVSQLYTEIGESVVPGKPLVELLAPDSLYVSAPIDEVDIGRVRERLPARVTLDAYPGVAYDGHVTRVAPFVSDILGQSRTMEIEVDLRIGPGQPRPRPGASADVEIILDTRTDVLRVPTFSVMERRHVLVVNGGKAEARDVKIGLHNWEFTEILSGLSAGDRVITSLDRPGVKDGARVKVEKNGSAP